MGVLKGVEKSLVKGKSYKFALEIVKLYRFLIKENEYIISKQLLKSETSIGANIEEALAGQSRADFLSKMSIASKEARETNYWLRLLRDSEFIQNKYIENLLIESESLIRILTSIVKTTSINNKQQTNFKTQN